MTTYTQIEFYSNSQLVQCVALPLGSYSPRNARRLLRVWIERMMRIETDREAITIKIRASEWE